jgi:hypothetical protein
VSCGYPFYLDGGVYSGTLGRTNHIAATFLNAPGAVVRAGVLASGGQMAVAAGSGMTVTVSTGYALCPSSAGSADGAYLFGLFSPATLTVVASDPTNPRVDLVTAYVEDNGDATSFSAVEILTGTPTSGATLSNLTGAPSIPDNGILLGYVLVPATSTSVTSGNILAHPTRTVAQGGVLPTQTGFQGTGYEGSYYHDVVTHRLMHNPPAGAAQPNLLPFVPQKDSVSSAPYNGGAAATVCSVTITTDGSTDIEIHASWRGFNHGAGGVGTEVGTFTLDIDGTQLKASQIENGSITLIRGGSAMFHVTSGGDDRPSSGSHTVTLQFSDNMATSGVNPSAVANAELYVRAVPL